LEAKLSLRKDSKRTTTSVWVLEFGDGGVEILWTDKPMGGLVFCCPLLSLSGRSGTVTGVSGKSKGVGAESSSGKVGAEISET
jgi:hypothetical protein